VLITAYFFAVGVALTGSAAARPQSFGHRSSTHVRCRIVSLMRGRCLIASAKMSRAFSRLLPAWSRRSTFVPSFGQLLDLVEIAIVRQERIISCFVGPIIPGRLPQIPSMRAKMQGT
jgi:hypothetical protein